MANNKFDLDVQVAKASAGADGAGAYSTLPIYSSECYSSACTSSNCVSVSAICYSSACITGPNQCGYTYDMYACGPM